LDAANGRLGGRRHGDVLDLAWWMSSRIGSRSKG
jgi:hypothetical protein